MKEQVKTGKKKYVNTDKGNKKRKYTKGKKRIRERETRCKEGQGSKTKKAKNK